MRVWVLQNTLWAMELVMVVEEKSRAEEVERRDTDSVGW